MITLVVVVLKMMMMVVVRSDNDEDEDDDCNGNYCGGIGDDDGSSGYNGCGDGG